MCIRDSLYSPQHDRDRDAAPQRAAATRLRETNEARTYLVCVASSRVLPGILLVRASCIACHGSTAQQQSAFTSEYIVPYCRCVRDVPTLKMRVVLFLVCIKNSTISSKHDHCCILVQVACFFFLGWDLALFFFFHFTYVHSGVSRHPVSYIVSACLVSYCLLVRQQQRFHYPTLRTTSLLWWDV